MIRISFLITHYNRPDDLLKCIKAINEVRNENDEIVVSDDHSDTNIVSFIKTYPIDKLVLAKRNNGLAANINKGLKECRGTYVIYCQEDFLLNQQLKTDLSQLIITLENQKVDLIRFSSYFDFNKTNDFDHLIDIIPKFSFYNFLHNFYRYSDHPFIVRRSFYNIYGYYLEGTSGRYGETEYAIRIANTNTIIGITKTRMAFNIEGSESTLINEIATSSYRPKISKKLFKIVRALRLYFEWVFYRKSRRGLITYKNGKKK